MPSYSNRSRPSTGKYRCESAPGSILRKKSTRWGDMDIHHSKKEETMLSAKVNAEMKRTEAEIILQVARKNLERAVRRTEDAKAAQSKVEQTALIYVTPVGKLPPAQNYEERGDEKKDRRRPSSEAREGDCNASVSSSALFSLSPTVNSSIAASTPRSRFVYDDCGKPIRIAAASSPIYVPTQVIDDDSYSLYSCDSAGSKSSRRSSSSSIVRRIMEHFPKGRKKSSRDDSSIISNGSKPVSIADSIAETVAESIISASLSQISASAMPAVRENQPLGGPKYYVATITKRGQAKVIHEAMSGIMDDGSSLKVVAEERGDEIMEYHMRPKMESTTSAGCGGAGLVNWKDDDSLVSNYTSGTAGTGMTGESGYTGTSGLTGLTGLTEATYSSQEPKGMCNGQNLLSPGTLATMGGCAGIVVAILLL